MSLSHITIGSLTNSDIPAMVSLINESLAGYEEVGTVLASIHRRLTDFQAVYSSGENCFLIARDLLSQKVIGGVGLGPLAGLPLSEGVGEIRELVIEPEHRGQGLGTRLLFSCLDTAKKLGFKRIYLETTPDMRPAQKLFQRFGFRPVRHHGQHHDSLPQSELPFYYLLEDIQPEPRKSSG